MRLIPANCADRFATYVVCYCLLLRRVSATASFSKCVTKGRSIVLYAMATVHLPLQIIMGDVTYTLNTDGGNA